MELRVIRQKGLLLNQLVRYTVTPSGNEDFYGATGILEFQPGEREVVVALVAIPDGLPEVGIVARLSLSKVFEYFGVFDLRCLTVTLRIPPWGGTG